MKLATPIPRAGALALTRILHITPRRSTLECTSSSSATATLPTTSVSSRPPPSTVLLLSSVWQQQQRSFSNTPWQRSWLEPNLPRDHKVQKGRARVPTGGSSKGTQVLHGDYGLRLVDFHRRISSKHLKDAIEAIRKRLGSGERYKLFPRVTCNHGVFVSGNEVRMGKGKGSFDHWSTRVAVNQIVIELKGMMHEKVARDAMRMAGTKLPGVWRFAKKGDPPIVGRVPMAEGVTLERLNDPRKMVLIKQLEDEAAQTGKPVPRIIPSAWIPHPPKL